MHATPQQGQAPATLPRSVLHMEVFQKEPVQADLGSAVISKATAEDQHLRITLTSKAHLKILPPACFRYVQQTQIFVKSV